MDPELIPWLVLAAIVGSMLALDLLVLNRDAKPVPFRKAAIWSIVWVSLALGFGAYVAVSQGSESGGEYLAGYLIELSLSVERRALVSAFMDANLEGTLDVSPQELEHLFVVEEVLRPSVVGNAVRSADRTREPRREEFCLHSEQVGDEEAQEVPAGDEGGGVRGFDAHCPRAFDVVEQPEHRGGGREFGTDAVQPQRYSRRRAGRWNGVRCAGRGPHVTIVPGGTDAGPHADDAARAPSLVAPSEQLGADVVAQHERTWTVAVGGPPVHVVAAALAGATGCAIDGVQELRRQRSGRPDPVDLLDLVRCESPHEGLHIGHGCIPVVGAGPCISPRQ